MVLAGIVAAAATCGSFVPQILATWRNKCAGAVSLVTFSILAVGGVVVGYFQFFVGHQHWTTALPPVATSLEQLVVILMCVYYDRNKVNGKLEELPYEKEPLLPSVESQRTEEPESIRVHAIPIRFCEEVRQNG